MESFYAPLFIRLDDSSTHFCNSRTSSDKSFKFDNANSVLSNISNHLPRSPLPNRPLFEYSSFEDNFFLAPISGLSKLLSEIYSKDDIFYNHVYEGNISGLLMW
uniref:Uncharacterized protein n=1 Tax=Glossina pallidipes TaxID=7398 RepID=A0A1A9ZM56_GLOPL